MSRSRTRTGQQLPSWTLSCLCHPLSSTSSFSLPSLAHRTLSSRTTVGVTVLSEDDASSCFCTSNTAVVTGFASRFRVFIGEAPPHTGWEYVAQGWELFGNKECWNRVWFFVRAEHICSGLLPSEKVQLGWQMMKGFNVPSVWSVLRKIPLQSRLCFVWTADMRTSAVRGFPSELLLAQVFLFFSFYFSRSSRVATTPHCKQSVLRKVFIVSFTPTIRCLGLHD